MADPEIRIGSSGPPAVDDGVDIMEMAEILAAAEEPTTALAEEDKPAQKVITFVEYAPSSCINRANPL